MHKKKNWLHRQTLLFWHRGGREVCAHFCFLSSPMKQCNLMWKHFTLYCTVCESKGKSSLWRKAVLLNQSFPIDVLNCKHDVYVDEIIVCPVFIPSLSLLHYSIWRDSTCQGYLFNPLQCFYKVRYVRRFVPTVVFVLLACCCVANDPQAAKKQQLSTSAWK